MLAVDAASQASSWEELENELLRFFCVLLHFVCAHHNTETCWSNRSWISMAGTSTTSSPNIMHYRPPTNRPLGARLQVFGYLSRSGHEVRENFSIFHSRTTLGRANVCNDAKEERSWDTPSRSPHIYVLYGTISIAIDRKSWSIRRFWVGFVLFTPLFPFWSYYTKLSWRRSSIICIRHAIWCDAVLFLRPIAGYGRRAIIMITKFRLMRASQVFTSFKSILMVCAVDGIEHDITDGADWVNGKHILLYFCFLQIILLWIAIIV